MAASETPSRIKVNLERIEGAFAARDGFSRPCWGVILKALRRYRTPEERPAAWSDVVSQWASRWEAELGEDYWMTSSGSFFLVSALDGDAAERLLQKADSLAEKIRGVLGPLAWEDRPRILIVHVADEFLARRFDEAVAAPEEQTDTERAAARLAPVWSLVCSQDEAVMVQDIEVALAWSALEHLALPRWLQGGVYTQLRRGIESARHGHVRELLDHDSIPEHRRFWNETTIQSFWAGTCETEYPAQANLFYELSNVLVQLLTEKTKSLVDYLRCAHHHDAGEAAARICFKMGLGELAGTFLGPGHWTPDPLAIVECWERVRQIKPDDEPGEGQTR